MAEALHLGGPMGRWLVLFAVACSVATDYEDTQYRCGDTSECPSGYECVEGLCALPGAVLGEGADPPPQSSSPDPASDPAPEPTPEPVPDPTPTEKTLTLPAIADTGVREDLPDNGYPAATSIWIDGGPDPDKTMLLRFDLAELPAGTTVLEARLRVVPTTVSAATFVVFCVREAWSEADATWIDRTANQAWSAAGVAGPPSRDAAPIGTFVPTGGVVDQVVVLDPTVVQAWIDGAAPNDGVSIATASTDGVHLATREAGAPLAPRLEITAIVP